MSRLFLMLVVVAAVSVMGCRTATAVRPADPAAIDQPVPVAMWIGVARHDHRGHLVLTAHDRAVLSALRDAGIEATMDEQGLHLALKDETRAREILLTDPKLSGSGVFVILAVRAGTGRRTECGFVFPSVGPNTAPARPADR